jgi:hypothetical protein
MSKIYFVAESQAKAIRDLIKASQILYDDACDRGENVDDDTIK